jgi:hypothetical protein
MFTQEPAAFRFVIYELLVMILGKLELSIDIAATETQIQKCAAWHGMRPRETSSIPRSGDEDYLIGAGSEDRTRDLKITNLALYQLSYPGGVVGRRIMWRTSQLTAFDDCISTVAFHRSSM